jgi:glycosyltransferase involved in cell wall biosynthesis
MARRIVHVITGLTRGGAEMMLYKLLSRMDRARFESSVVCLKSEGAMAERIRALGIPVDRVEMRGTPGDLARLARLRRVLRERAPDLIQTWLYHADLLGGLAASLSGRPPVVWGIRMSKVDTLAFRKTTVAIARLCARLSWSLPERIVCCSETGRQMHAEFGYDARKMVVIPNGFDVEQFRPDPSARASVREELAVPASAPLIGLVARFDPHKDHATFVAASALVAARFPEARYLLVGHGVEPSNATLRAAISAAGLGDRARLLGARDDVARLTAACDLAVSSSFGEGFSNAIGEAMACGVPCVATDVGDSAWLVGDTGRVVAPRDPAALAQAIGELLAIGPEGRAALGAAGRGRIVEHFELSRVVRRYEQLYLELTDDVRH